MRGTEGVFSTNANELAPDERERERPKERIQDYNCVLEFIISAHCLSHGF